MENNLNNVQDQQAQVFPDNGVPGMNPTPKTFDLSAVNSLNSNQDGMGNFFKKKPFIVGILSVLLLIIVGVGGLYFTQIATKKGPGPQPKAAECKNVQLSVGSRSPDVGDTAYLVGQATNNCSSPVIVYKLKFWCLGVGLPCSEHEKVEQVTLEPGASVSFDVRQEIGNNKNNKCGSAQVDVMFTRNFDPNSGFPMEGVYSSFGNACTPPPSNRECTDVTLDRNSITPGVTNRLEAIVSGGNSGVTFGWTVDTDGEKGTFHSQESNPTLWRAPLNPTSGQTWTFRPHPKIGETRLQNEECLATLTYSTTPQTYSHNVCNANKACVSVPCNPATTNCSASTDCKTAADCQTTTFKFTTCENNACVSKDCPNPNVSCSQSDDCKNDNDCKSTPTHKVCQNNACVTVNGAGSDSCTSDATCQPEATPPPIPESGNTLMTLGTIAVGALAILGGIFLAL